MARQQTLALPGSRARPRLAYPAAAAERLQAPTRHRRHPPTMRYGLDVFDRQRASPCLLNRMLCIDSSSVMAVSGRRTVHSHQLNFCSAEVCMPFLGMQCRRLCLVRDRRRALAGRARRRARAGRAERGGHDAHSTNVRATALLSSLLPIPCIMQHHAQTSHARPTH